MMPPWVGDYVGVPFKDRGFDPNGWHCWGLVWHVFKKHSGVEVSRYGDLSAGDFNTINNTIINATTIEGEWLTIIGERKLFDVLVMRGRVRGQKLLFHVGVMVTKTDVLHVEEKQKTAIVPIDHLSIRNRLISTHRHRQLI